jgi:RNA polymerase sigma-70 factor, ECF subfamily
VDLSRGVVTAPHGSEDSDGLRDLYLRTQPRLVVQVAALTGDIDVAEELVQEAFGRCVERWDRIRGYDDPEAWVRAVAFNLARSRWRRLKRFAAALARLDRRPNETEASGDHLVLLCALARLDPSERDVVVMHHLLDLPTRQVALRLGVPEGTVKTRLSRGRAHLAELIGPTYSGDHEHG